MRQTKFLSAALFAAAAVIATPAANATVKVLGAGSSAMWQSAALGAYSLAGGSGSGAGHFTIKGTAGCTTNANCAQIHDSRSASILPEGGNLWVVWNSAQTEIWAYISVDSVVGNRAYFAVPRTTLQVDPAAESGSGFATNLIASALWGTDAANIPSTVYTALNNASITTAFTDIRPEDAKFAICRVLNALDTANYSGFGYGTGTTCSTLIGTQILSDFSSAVANPVNFNIKGTDPFTGDAVPASTTIDVGASPIVFIVNRTNPNGLGYGGAGTPTITNLTVPQAQLLWTGDHATPASCDTALWTGGPPTSVPVHVMQREPMSGTMNTTEFTTFRCGNTDPTSSSCPVTGHASYIYSQEQGVVPPPEGTTNTNNPLDLPCGIGTRQRAIGTSEMDSTAVLNTADSIGYTFWGYGNVAKLAGSYNYGYLTLNSIDPIQSSYSDGVLPTCTAPCPLPAGTSFPNLRNGTYTAWSVLRVVTNAATPTATKQLVVAIQDNITSVPDFVPFAAVGSDPGLQYYRSHFLRSGVSPNNGLSSEKEAGGDEGGMIEPVGPAPGVLNVHQ